MTSDNLYLLTALPSLGRLGDQPPIDLPELLAHVADSATSAALAEAIFLSDDLLQRDAVAAGELTEPTPTVLTVEQLRDEAPLPACLVVADTAASARRVACDAVWEAYYRHVADVASGCGCRLLAQWVGVEVALRNALARARAQALGLDGEDYVVADDLADDDADLTSIVNDWSTARTPLAGLRVLDDARWRWLDENDQWFTFADDELAAYAIRIMLLSRWYRLTETDDADDTAPAASQ